jgi:hypothetical protein
MNPVRLLDKRRGRLARACAAFTSIHRDVQAAVIVANRRYSADTLPPYEPEPSAGQPRAAERWMDGSRRMIQIMRIMFNSRLHFLSYVSRARALGLFAGVLAIAQIGAR